MELHFLNPEDVAQLRAMPKGRANYKVRHALVADYRRDHGWALTIITTTEQPPGVEPSSVDVRYRFAVDGRNEMFRREDNVTRLVASATCYGDNGPFALGNLVKAGDHLRIHFQIGNDTDNLRNAGMTHDLCFIEVFRGGDKDPRKAKLISKVLLDDIISPVGGYTMVDRHYKPERDGNVA